MSINPTLDGLRTERREPVPGMHDLVDPAHHDGSHIIFLNPCWDGCTIQPGYEDSRNNRSQFISSTANITAYPGSQSSWNQMVECFRENYEPFNVTITDVDPGNVPHHEAIVAGFPTQAGADNQTLGFAGGSCYGAIDNAISFSFAGAMFDYYGDVPWFICEVAAQESAHAFGQVEHLRDPCNIMTYMEGCEGDQEFQNQYVACGEYSNRACDCGGSQKNVFEKLMGLFGPAAASPPTVDITAPSDGSQVEAGFIVRVNVSDEQGVDRVELFLDNQKIDTGTIPPYIFNSPLNVSQGNHTVKITAYDTLGSSASDSVTVSVGTPCGGNDDCDGAGEVCVDGSCVPGPDAEGGLGDTCTEGTECASGTCGTVGADSLCTVACNPEANGCPSGFECLSTGGGTGACWPGEGGGGGGGGCAVGSGRDTLWSLLLLGLVLGAVRRRRRR